MILPCQPLPKLLVGLGCLLQERAGLPVTATLQEHVCGAGDGRTQLLEPGPGLPCQWGLHHLHQAAQIQSVWEQEQGAVAIPF